MSKNIKYEFLIFVGLFFILFVWNLLFLPQSDDFAHYFSAIDSNRNFLTSYFTWNGRFGELLSAGFFGKFFFGPFAWIFDFLNALVGVIYFYMFFLMCFARFPHNKEDFLSFAFIVGFICVFGHFGAVFLWGAGALNYLWGVGFILCFLIPFRLFYWEKFIEKSNTLFSKPLFFWMTSPLLMFILGFLAGMSSEFIGIAVIFVLMFGFCVALEKKWKLPLWQYAGFFGVSIGWMALFLSPGSRSRAELIAQEGRFISFSDFFDSSLLDMLLLINQTFNSSASSLIFRVFLFVFVVFICNKMYSLEKFREYSRVKKSVVAFLFLLFCILTLVFSKYVCALLLYATIFFYMIKLVRINHKYFVFLGLFIVLLFMDLSLLQLHGDIAPRAEVGKDLVLVAMMVFMLRELYVKYPSFLGRLIVGQLIVGILFVSVGCYSVWRQSNYVKDEVLGKGFQDDIVLSKKARFNKILERYFLDYSHITDNPNHWVNQTIARFYGVKSLRVEQ